MYKYINCTHILVLFNNIEKYREQKHHIHVYVLISIRMIEYNKILLISMSTTKFFIDVQN